ncbi:MAG TPA: hypothetical protein ENN51_01105, partial [candidate division WOR-3 bacterium]|nr:hypothetical protein [candidate division WOR-3 bacterium]
MITEPLPALLIVQPTRARYQTIIRHLREYGDGSIGREFEFFHLDCYEALSSWYARNPGRFVSLVIIGLDFSELAESGKLLGYPELKYPVPKDFDALRFQGLLVYVFLRENGLDGDVPVLLVSEAPETEDSRRYYSFMLYPAQGACQLIYIPPGPDGPVLVAERTAALALRPLDENQRAHWRKAHQMVVGGARRMVCLAREIERLGPGESVVLVLGKPGVGKELVANALHRCSLRFVADDPVRAWPSTANIAAIARNLIEVELFGHTRGAYTGSVGEREGVFEYGNGSTVFLDEIGDISNEVQLKLLRVMENRRVKR